MRGAEGVDSCLACYCSEVAKSEAIFTAMGV
jgi:hypothetical protein